MQEDSLPAEPQEKPKDIGVDSPLSLLQHIFPTQESDLGHGLLFWLIFFARGYSENPGVVPPI